MAHRKYNKYTHKTYKHNKLRIFIGIVIMFKNVLDTEAQNNGSSNRAYGNSTFSDKAFQSNKKRDMEGQNNDDMIPARIKMGIFMMNKMPFYHT